MNTNFSNFKHTVETLTKKYQKTWLDKTDFNKYSFDNSVNYFNPLNAGESFKCDYEKVKDVADVVFNKEDPSQEEMRALVNALIYQQTTFNTLQYAHRTKI